MLPSSHRRRDALQRSEHHGARGEAKPIHIVFTLSERCSASTSTMKKSYQQLNNRGAIALDGGLHLCFFTFVSFITCFRFYCLPLTSGI